MFQTRLAEQSSADYRGKLGRYALYGEIAAGGMATVHLARLLGPVGFARTVAIKRLHPHLAKDPDFVGMFLEEARLAARVKHPNVVSTLDVVNEDGELFLVMEYIAGESLSRLVRKTREAGGTVSPRFVVGILCGALEGLHAAHEAKTERGTALGLVHRDVSPQNIHVGMDGIPRVLDFGIAKATNRVQETRTDQIKGKVAYMSPEQLAKGNVDRRADVYSASVVLWEALTGQRLFKADDVPSLVYSIINDEVRLPSTLVPDLPKAFDTIVMKGLDREATNRWSSAREMAEALEKVVVPAPAREIGPWVEEAAGEALAYRQDLVHRIESETSSSLVPPIPSESPRGGSETSGVVPADAEPEDEDEDEDDIEGPTLKHHASGRQESVAEDERETLVQPTSQREPDLSIYDPNEAAPHSRAGLVLMVLAGILLLGGAALFGLRWMQLKSEEIAPPADSTDPGPGPAIVLSGAARTSPTPVPTPSASQSAKPSATVIVAPPPTHSHGTTVHDECDNPFITDARGIRHPKPQCFKR
jgi:serine/threonine-protein kinase